MQVVKKGKTSGKGKGVHIKQQSSGVQAGSSPDTCINAEKLVNVKQLHAQIAAVSKALAELDLSGDKELMQPLESRRAELKARLHGARPIGGLRGVISRCQKRLAEAEIAKVEAEATIIKETEDIANYQAQLAELEALFASSAGFRKADGPDSVMPEWLANTLSSIAKHVQESSNIDRDAVAQSLLGLLVPAPPLSHQMRYEVERWTILPTCAMCRIAGASTRAVQTGH